MKYLILLLVLVCSPSFAQSSSSSTGSSSSAASSVGKFDLRIGWKAPTEREDGETFYPYEIAGYEVRYKKVSDLVFKPAINLGPTLLKYQITNVPYDDYYIEISVYDQNGFYSKFVSIQYIRPPMSVNDLILKISTIR